MATRSRNGVGSLLGILVLATIAFILLNMFNLIQVGFGSFGCGWKPNVRWGATAEAASDDSCPTSISGAMSDAKWAADRFATIKDKYVTTGLMYDQDGIEHEIISGDEKGADAERARRILREVGAPSIGGQYPAATHVEVKAAALMRETEVKTAILVINYEDGPCPPIGLGLSCQDVLPKLLPAGYRLRVWYSNAQGEMHFADFP